MSERDDLTEQVFHTPEVVLEGNRRSRSAPQTAVGYGVELGGQFFTHAQWEVIQTYAKGTSSPTEGYGQNSEEIQSLIHQGEQGLDYMLGLQRKVEEAFDRLPDPSNAEQVSTYIREVILCATDELHEVLAEVHWKPWKDSRGIKDIPKYRGEMADVLHFILDLYLAAGMTGREIISDYMTKHYENLSRSNRAEYLAS